MITFYVRESMLCLQRRCSVSRGVVWCGSIYGLLTKITRQAGFLAGLIVTGMVATRLGDFHLDRGESLKGNADCKKFEE